MEVWKTTSANTPRDKWRQIVTMPFTDERFPLRSLRRLRRKPQADALT